jgi:uncharacterized protein YndB with AHSA1/START domain
MAGDTPALQNQPHRLVFAPHRAHDGNRATVKKVNPGKNIRLVWEDEALTLPAPVEIKFAPSGAKCTVMVTIDRLQTRAEADGYRRAWGEALDRLKA